MSSEDTPAFERHPDAHRIGSDAEALRIAHDLAAEFAVEAAARDRDRRLPAAELDRFSGFGLWGTFNILLDRGTMPAQDRPRA